MYLIESDFPMVGLGSWLGSDGLHLANQVLLARGLRLLWAERRIWAWCRWWVSGVQMLSKPSDVSRWI